MSFEKIENASGVLIDLENFLKDCTDSKFEATEREFQVKGLHSALKNFFLEIKDYRILEINKKLKERIRELEQSPESSTTSPEE